MSQNPLVGLMDTIQSQIEYTNQVRSEELLEPILRAPGSNPIEALAVLFERARKLDEPVEQSSAVSLSAPVASSCPTSSTPPRISATGNSPSTPSPDAIEGMVGKHTLYLLAKKPLSGKARVKALACAAALIENPTSQAALELMDLLLFDSQGAPPE